jgi:hypothetical protein
VTNKQAEDNGQTTKNHQTDDEDQTVTNKQVEYNS